MSEDNKAKMRRFFEEVVQRGNISAGGGPNPTVGPLIAHNVVRRPLFRLH